MNSAFIPGASVNTGKDNGLGVLLARALEKGDSFIVHHCSAHRDQLIFQKSMELYKDFVTLETEVNSLYRVSIIFFDYFLHFSFGLRFKISQSNIPHSV